VLSLSLSDKGTSLKSSDWYKKIFLNLASLTSFISSSQHKKKKADRIRMIVLVDDLINDYGFSFILYIMS
mgnify:CR=1